MQCCYMNASPGQSWCRAWLEVRTTNVGSQSSQTWYLARNSHYGPLRVVVNTAPVGSGWAITRVHVLDCNGNPTFVAPDSPKFATEGFKPVPPRHAGRHSRHPTLGDVPVGVVEVHQVGEHLPRRSGLRGGVRALTSVARTSRPPGHRGSGSPVRTPRSRSTSIQPWFSASYNAPCPRRCSGGNDNPTRVRTGSEE